MSLQQPTGLWTNKFVYDAAGRLTNVTSPAGAFAYTVGGASAASSLVKKIALPNSSYITNTYGSVARLTGTYLDNSANSSPRFRRLRVQQRQSTHRLHQRRRDLRSLFLRQHRPVEGGHQFGDHRKSRLHVRCRLEPQLPDQRRHAQHLHGGQPEPAYRRPECAHRYL